MACSASRDENGTTYHIPEAKAVTSPGGHTFPGCPAVDIWWGRRFRKTEDETLMIRQERPGAKRADVVEITLGQVYDAIHALGWAVMRP